MGYATFNPNLSNANEPVYAQGFNPTVAPIEPESVNTVGLNFSNVDNDIEVSTDPVSIDINPIVETAPVVNGSKAVIMQINPIAEEKRSIQQFGVQSIPEGEERSMLPNPNIFESIMESVNAHLNKQASAKPEFVTRKMSNWITRLLDQRGEDYISSGKLTADEVGRNCDRIIDDMIAGRIDYTKQGQYFIEPVIIETLINFCVNKLAINRAIQYSLGYVYNDYTNRYNISINDTNRIQSLACIDDSLSHNITQAISIVNQDIAVYDIIYNRLQYVNATKNAFSLFNLAAELNQVRKQIKKRY